MKEYIWLKPHFQYAYVKGNVCKLKKADADKLIKTGHIKLFERPKAVKKEKAVK